MSTVVVLPARCALVPVGAPGSGKSTALARMAAELGDPGFRFGADDVRLLAFGTRAYQGAGQHVHTAARSIFAARLASGRPAAYDATNTTRRERRPLVELAARYRRPAVAGVFRAPVDVLRARNAVRAPDAVVPEEALTRMAERVGRITAEQLRREGFALVVDVDHDDPVNLRVPADGVIPVVGPDAPRPSPERAP